MTAHSDGKSVASRLDAFPRKTCRAIFCFITKRLFFLRRMVFFIFRFRKEGSCEISLSFKFDERSVMIVKSYCDNDLNFELSVQRKVIIVYTF